MIKTPEQEKKYRTLKALERLLFFLNGFLKSLKVLETTAQSCKEYIAQADAELYEPMFKHHAQEIDKVLAVVLRYFKNKKDKSLGPLKQNLEQKLVSLRKELIKLGDPRVRDIDN